MSCPTNDVEFSDVLKSAAPSLIPFALALLRASTSEASYAKRLAGLSLLCLASVGMTLFGGCSLIEIGIGSHQQGGLDSQCSGGIFATGHAQSTAVSFSDTAWYSDIYEYAPLFDLGIVFMATYSVVITEGLPGMLWTVGALLVFLVHGVGLLINSLAIDTAITAAALLATGVLNGIGGALGGALDFLPKRLRVSEPITHALVALIFIIAMPFANKDAAYTAEPKLEDIFASAPFVFTVVSIAALAAMSYEASEPVKQITSLSGASALLLANYHATMDAIGAQSDGGIRVEGAASRCKLIAESVYNVLGIDLAQGTDLLAAVGIAAAPAFLALALVLTVTETHPHFGGPAKAGLTLKDIGSMAEKYYHGEKGRHCTSVTVVEGDMCTDSEAPGAITLCAPNNALRSGTRAGAMP